MDHTQILEQVFDEAAARLLQGAGTPVPVDLSPQEISLLETIGRHAETNKAVLTVLITSLTQKIFDPNQDTRYHQHGLPGGYSGRTIDMKFVTPFMKSKQFPAMAESGWLTRSLEQNLPYTHTFPGKITPKDLKSAFLQILDNIEIQQKDPKEHLCYLFQLLLILRDQKAFDLAKPSDISIDRVLYLLESHIGYPYSVPGAARLPVLAVYSIYECMMSEMARFSAKKLLPLKEHTTSDKRAGSIGDIEIADTQGNFFEAVEIKHGIKITLQTVNDAFEKFKGHPVKRFYILSTAGVEEQEEGPIKTRIQEIAQLHGCQVIVNGIIPSLKYYLRLLEEPVKVIDRYVENLKKDKAVKFQHEEVWNKLVAGSHSNSTGGVGKGG